MKGNDGVQRIYWSFAAVVVLFFINSTFAYADGGWRDHGGFYHRRCDIRPYWHHRHHYYRHDQPTTLLSSKYLTIEIGGQRDCRGRGRCFIKHRHREFVEIEDPVRVVITTLPRNCRKVYIDGRVYYSYNGDYYEKVGGGYRQAKDIRSENGAYDQENERPVRGDGEDISLSVNIPNKNGGYTSVTLKRSGDGYLGPQGEYYAEFPKVEQLRVMYAKE